MCHTKQEEREMKHRFKQDTILLRIYLKSCPFRQLNIKAIWKFCLPVRRRLKFICRHLWPKTEFSINVKNNGEIIMCIYCFWLGRQRWMRAVQLARTGFIREYGKMPDNGLDEMMALAAQDFV